MRSAHLRRRLFMWVQSSFKQRIYAGSAFKTAQRFANVSNESIARPEIYCAMDCWMTPVCSASSFWVNGLVWISWTKRSLIWCDWIIFFLRKIVLFQPSGMRNFRIFNDYVKSTKKSSKETSKISFNAINSLTFMFIRFVSIFAYVHLEMEMPSNCSFAITSFCVYFFALRSIWIFLPKSRSGRILHIW